MPLLVWEEQQMISYTTSVPIPLTNPHVWRRWKIRRLFIGLCAWLLTILCQLQGHFEDPSVVGCDAIRLGELLQTFRKTSARSSRQIAILLWLLDPEDEGVTILRNVWKHSSSDMASQPRKHRNIEIIIHHFSSYLLHEVAVTSLNNVRFTRYANLDKFWPSTQYFAWLPCCCYWFEECVLLAGRTEVSGVASVVESGQSG